MAKNIKRTLKSEDIDINEDGSISIKKSEVAQALRAALEEEKARVSLLPDETMAVKVEA